MSTEKLAAFIFVLVVGMFTGGALVTDNLDEIELQCIDTEVVNMGS